MGHVTLVIMVLLVCVRKGGHLGARRGRGCWGCMGASQPGAGDMVLFHPRSGPHCPPPPTTPRRRGAASFSKFPLFLGFPLEWLLGGRVQQRSALRISTARHTLEAPQDWGAGGRLFPKKLPSLPLAGEAVAGTHTTLAPQAGLQPLHPGPAPRLATSIVLRYSRGI